jgi:hypothetical protein
VRGSEPSDAAVGYDKKRMRRGGRLEREPDGRERRRLKVETRRAAKGEERQSVK